MRPNVVVGVVGATGAIGGTLIKQLTAASAALIVGVTSSRCQLFNAAGMGPTWREELTAGRGQALDLAGFAHLVHSAAASGSDKGGQPGCGIIVDCSASDSVPDMYLEFVRSGLHVVTPNKKFMSGPLARYQQLQALCAASGRQFKYEATVGAGLPVISTLQALQDTGDQVLCVEGVLSGTLSYIFNAFKPGRAFSEVVVEAQSRGYTEPDPREDLSGLDVARKVVILARQCGLPLELSSLAVSSLVPPALAQPEVSVQQFLQQLPQYDADMAAQSAEAAAAGEVLRYVGRVDVEEGTASVSTARYPADHPFAQLQGSDNQIVFTTKRYRDQPLIVRGPGAGAEVTAAGVFGDIIQISRTHGACTA